MIIKKWFVFLCCIYMIPIMCAQEKEQEKRIVVLMVGSNAIECVEKALQSIFSQRYTNYALIYIETGEADGTMSFIKEYADSLGKGDRVSYYFNKGEFSHIFLNSLAQIRPFFDDQDIVLVLSPYDFFPHTEVFTYINRVYASGDVWMTYGPKLLYPSLRLINNSRIPDVVFEFNAYRNYLYTPHFLHSCYASLLKKIKAPDLFLDNVFLKTADDLAVMLPMLEMAKGHVHFVTDVLFVHNSELDAKRFSIDSDTQDAINVRVRNYFAYDKLNAL